MFFTDPRSVNIGPQQRRRRMFAGAIFTCIALALIGAILPWRLPRRGRPLPYLAAGICFALTLLLVFGYRLPPLQALPFVTALNAGRYLLFATFFMSFLAGLGGAALKRWRPANMRVQTLSLPILLLLGDLGPTTFQQPYTFLSLIHI